MDPPAPETLMRALELLNYLGERARATWSWSQLPPPHEQVLSALACVVSAVPHSSYLVQARWMMTGT